MINFELRKTHHVHDRRTVFVDVLRQLSCHLFLLMSAKRPNHPPMPALNVTPPGPTAFLFQHCRPCFAESVKVGIAWNDNTLPFWQKPGWADRDHLCH